MTNSLHNNLKKALTQYVTNPDSTEYKGALLSAAFHVFQKVVSITNSTEADVNIPFIANFLVKCNLDSLQMSKEIANRLDNLARTCGQSDDRRVRETTDVLTILALFYNNQKSSLAHEMALRSLIYSFLDSMRSLSSELVFTKLEKDTNTLDQELIEHFDLTEAEQKKNYPHLAKKTKDFIQSSGKMIDKESLPKTIAYNIVAAIAGLGIFYGLYLYLTRTERNTLFLQPKEQVVFQKSTQEIMQKLEEEPPPASNKNKAHEPLKILWGSGGYSYQG